MKKITIYQRDSSDVEIFDDTNEHLDEYCQDLAKIFNLSNVVILKTSKSTFIGRPSQLTSLTVEDIELSSQQSENPPEKDTPDVDVITDID